MPRMKHSGFLAQNQRLKPQKTALSLRAKGILILATACAGAYLGLFLGNWLQGKTQTKQSTSAALQTHAAAVARLGNGRCQQNAICRAANAQHAQTLIALARQDASNTLRGGL